MICACVNVTNLDNVVFLINAAQEHADVVELRLDLLETIDFTALQSIINKSPLPLILTIRSQKQGGKFTGDKLAQQQIYQQLVVLQPAYMDIEHDTPKEFVKELNKQYPLVKFIISYHNFESTPHDLNDIFNEMKLKIALWYKIAVYANSTTDMLRLMAWTLGKKNVIAISMGEDGRASRVIGPVIGCPLSYGSIDKLNETAPGQIPICLLNERYRLRTINSSTAIYGLIGDPIDESISDYTHNKLFADLGINAVYVKLRIPKEQLETSFSYLKMLPFKGLSVTMPLKEVIQGLCNSGHASSRGINALNTLIWDNDIIKGANTDAKGALNALEAVQKVKGKVLWILGAGGAAKAIVNEAVARGAIVTIFNRDAQKAIALAKHYHCRGFGFNEMEACVNESYDMLINTTAHEMPIDPEYILENRIVMDIKTKPMHTRLIEEALKRKCKIVPGFHMFVEQAVGQFNLWFGQSIDLNKCQHLLKKYAYNFLNNFES